MRTNLPVTAVAALLVMVVGCDTGSHYQSKGSVAQGNDAPTVQTPPVQTNAADTLPINQYVQELRNQAMQGVQFFPLSQPRLLTEIDVTATLKQWQDKMLQDVSTQTQPRRGDVFTVEGTSVFMLYRAGDNCFASWDIPSAEGKTSTRGAIWQESNQDPMSGRSYAYPVLSGLVWTPRVSVIGKLDLSVKGDVTTSSDFDFEAFKNSPGVIPFADGYAVNLFGQKVNEGGVLDVNGRPKGNYVTDAGVQLCGRLVRNRSGKFEETILQP